MTITLAIVVEKDKVSTSYKEGEITLQEVSLLTHEMERIKLDLLTLEWENEFRVKKSGEGEE